jgi:hypothetical protein
METAATPLEVVIPTLLKDCRAPVSEAQIVSHIKDTLGAKVTQTQVRTALYGGNGLYAMVPGDPPKWYMPSVRDAGGVAPQVRNSPGAAAGDASGVAFGDTTGLVSSIVSYSDLRPLDVVLDGAYGGARVVAAFGAAPDAESVKLEMIVGRALGALQRVGASSVTLVAPWGDGDRIRAAAARFETCEVREVAAPGPGPADATERARVVDANRSALEQADATMCVVIGVPRQYAAMNLVSMAEAKNLPCYEA